MANIPLRPWFVYILKCSNNALYTGITTDVRKRLAVHNAGKGSAYVRAHRPAKLVAFTAADSRSSASAMEYSVKAMSRPKKVALAKAWKAGQSKRSYSGQKKSGTTARRQPSGRGQATAGRQNLSAWKSGSGGLPQNRVGAGSGCPDPRTGAHRPSPSAPASKSSANPPASRPASSTSPSSGSPYRSSCPERFRLANVIRSEYLARTEYRPCSTHSHDRLAPPL